MQINQEGSINSVSLFYAYDGSICGPNPVEVQYITDIVVREFKQFVMELNSKKPNT